MESYLTSKQKEFLKTIKNKKYRQYQKVQFKLQNQFEKYNYFVDGKLTTNNSDIIKTFNNHPLYGVLFKEEEVSIEGKTWHETTTYLAEEKLQDNMVENFKKIRELSLKHLTKPKIIKEKLFAEIDKYAESVFKDLSETDYEKIPQEFCVEITEENKEVLTNAYQQYPVNLQIGSYIIHIEGDEIFNYPTKPKNKLIVSTEEFLRYIGKEELIDKKHSGSIFDMKISKETFENHKKFRDNPYLVDEVGIWNPNPIKNHWKIDSAKTDEPKPLDFDFKKDDNKYRFELANTILEYNKNIIKCIQMKSDPTSMINEYLIMIQKFYHINTADKLHLDFDLPKKEYTIEDYVFTEKGCRFKYKKVLELLPESNVYELTMIDHSFYEKVLI